VARTRDRRWSVWPMPPTARVSLYEPDTCSMWDKLTRRNLILILAMGAVCFGAAGWLLWGPLWAIAGMVAGAVIAFIVVLIVMLIAVPDAPAMAKDRPGEALKRLQADIRTAQIMARIWPNQWRGALANRLAARSYALQLLRQYEQALSSASEAVQIYQGLAAERPAKYAPHLADALDRQSRLLAVANREVEARAAMETAVRLYRNLAVGDPGKYLPVLADALTCMSRWLAEIDDDSGALAAAREATDIYWHKLPWPEVPSRAVMAALLAGQLLCRQARYHDATSMLARGWQLAASHHLKDALSNAMPALNAAYHADPDDFAAVWRSETGTEPPDWLRR
jgi:tetratricopeptide (TPR) repeat protein